MKKLTLCILAIVILVYILIGGAIFYALEGDHETSTRTATLGSYQSFVANKACVSNAELETFVKTIIWAYDQGIIATTNTSSASVWNYGNSVFFAMTAVTTIGYGNQTPVTSGGRVFVILFALIGIPLVLVFLGGLGNNISELLDKFKNKEFAKDHPKAEKIIKTVVIVVTMMSLMFLIPAGIFTAIEDWTYGESLYYCFVTLTTIGFGDFVPGTNDTDYRIAYRLLTGVYIYFGLATMATVISQFSSRFEKIQKKLEARSQKKTKGDENDLEIGAKSQDPSETEGEKTADK